MAEQVKRLILPKIHLHPISSHFPSAFFPFSAVFLMLLLWKGDNVFELGAKITLWAGTLTNPVAIASGFIDWKAKYKAAMVPIFKKKITYSIATQFLAIICVVWHYVSPDVMFNYDIFSYIYVTLIISSSIFIIFVGRWGAKLVYL